MKMKRLPLAAVLWACWTAAAAAESSNPPLRRMRKFVEIADLEDSLIGGPEQPGNEQTTKSRRAADRLIAHEELYRLLQFEDDGYSMSMGGSPSIANLPTAPDSAPVAAPVNQGAPSPLDGGDGGEVGPRELEIQQKCGITEEQRSDAILAILSTVSRLDALLEEGTSQYMARMWLDQQDPAIICIDSNGRLQQRYTTALLYYDLSGEEWNNCGVESEQCVNTDDQVTREAIRWMSLENECLWFGLLCQEELDTDTDDAGIQPDTYMTLTKLQLKRSGLAGTLPLELFTLTDLRTLTLDGNVGIKGTIPEAIRELKELEFIDLDDNMFSGSLPNGLYELTNLKAVDLNSNQFTGTLSGNIGDLRQLEIFQIENNLLTGTVPTAGLFLLERMIALTMYDNELTGSVEEICAVRNERREEYEPYLQFFQVDCEGGDDDEEPPVECSCCECF